MLPIRGIFIVYNPLRIVVRIIIFLLSHHLDIAPCNSTLLSNHSIGEGEVCLSIMSSSTPSGTDSIQSLVRNLGGLSLTLIDDSSLPQFNSLFKNHLETRLSGYQGGVKSNPSPHPSGGFISSVAFEDYNKTHYLVQTPRGTKYQNMKQANGAASKVAYEMLKAGQKPPLASSVVQTGETISTTTADDHRIKKLEMIIKRVIQDRELALRALRHSSAGLNNHDALAFLGDAIIGYLMALEAFTTAPNASVQDLHYTRSRQVENEEFQRIAHEIGLAELLEVGGGTNGSMTGKKMVADMFEAVIAVLWFEGGEEAVLKFWRSCH